MAMAEGHKCFFSMPEGSGRDCSWLYSFLGITLYNYVQLYMPCLQNCVLKRSWGAGAEPMPKDTAGVLEEQCALGGREGCAARQFVISFSNMAIWGYWFGSWKEDVLALPRRIKHASKGPRESQGAELWNVILTKVRENLESLGARGMEVSQISNFQEYGKMGQNAGVPLWR